MLKRFVGVLLLLLPAIATAARAQSGEYTAPGGPGGRPEDRKGQLAQETTNARYHLGAVRLAPTFSLQDVSYVRNLLGSGGAATPNDLTATVQAGFRAYLPASPNATFTAYVLPQYVWWQKEVDRRHLDGLYGAGFDGFWNRLTLRLQVSSDATQQVVSAELPTLANARNDEALAQLELRLTSAIYAYVHSQVSRAETLTNAGDASSLVLAELDRDVTVTRAGLHWRPTVNWLVGVGAEYTEVHFLDDAPQAIDRSNRGTSPILEIERLNSPLYISLDVADRRLTAEQGAAFVQYNKPTGQATVAYAFVPEVELFLYAHRDLEYSIDPDYSYFDDSRYGASLHVQIGRRTTLSVFGEAGKLDYTAITAGVPDRTDDLVAWGGSLNMRLTRGVSVGITGSSTRFTSDLPGFGRSLNTVGLTVTLVAGQANSVVGPPS